MDNSKYIHRLESFNTRAAEEVVPGILKSTKNQTLLSELILVCVFCHIFHGTDYDPFFFILMI
jgi:hypothetical protein